MARVKMVTMANPNIPNMTFLANLMELKKGKFTAEITQMVHGEEGFGGRVRTLSAQIPFTDMNAAETFCNQMGLQVDGHPAWMVIEAFKNDASIVPAQTPFDFSSNQEATE